MARDFNLKTYSQLLKTLQKQGFSFQTFQEFLNEPAQHSIILRHDVDKLPGNSFRFAQIQNELNIKGSYYFRIFPESFNSKIINEIAKLGHEIGYHYEDVDIASKLLKHHLPGKDEKEIQKLIAQKAITLFENHLKIFRKNYPVKTICMHGSPRSKFDNKLLWKYYNYQDYNIIGEPYFDINFQNVFYLTDTGRRWDGWKTSVRDKMPQQEKWIKEGLVFHSTNDIIKAAAENLLPPKIMITVHPQRWTDKPLPWSKELVMQSIKNQIKRFFYIK